MSYEEVARAEIKRNNDYDALSEFYKLAKTYGTSTPKDLAELISDLHRQVCENADEYFKELRRTKRALWIARAETCSANAYAVVYACHSLDWEEQGLRWQWAERKCREKAEEYA